MCRAAHNVFNDVSGPADAGSPVRPGRPSVARNGFELEGPELA